MKQPRADPLLLEAAEGLAAVIPQHLPAIRPPAPTPQPAQTTTGAGQLTA
ncbi:hypothetical protein ACIRVF_30365 [Kitasatospora sp. NPDC101157]